jgi:hypothetical protein
LGCSGRGAEARGWIGRRSGGEQGERGRRERGKWDVGTGCGVGWGYEVWVLGRVVGGGIRKSGWGVCKNDVNLELSLLRVKIKFCGRVNVQNIWMLMLLDLDVLDWF